MRYLQFSDQIIKLALGLVCGIVVCFLLWLWARLMCVWCIHCVWTIFNLFLYF